MDEFRRLHKVAKKLDMHALTCMEYSEQDTSVPQSPDRSTSCGTHSVETVGDPDIS